MTHIEQLIQKTVRLRNKIFFCKNEKTFNDRKSLKIDRLIFTWLFEFCAFVSNPNFQKAFNYISLNKLGNKLAIN